MIFVMAGTRDGREAALGLAHAGLAVTASVVSRYGEELLREGGERLAVNSEPLDEAALTRFFVENQVTLCLDASHPYAAQASVNAMAAAHASGIEYLRLERDLSALDYEKVHVVHSYEEAAATAASLGERVFLTTGSRNLEKFTTAPELAGHTVIARVLPTAEVIGKCEELGLLPREIVALEGPFSEELNRELFRKYRADVVVTKNSGALGGTDTKLAAARALGLPLVVIDRPQLDYDEVVHSAEEAVKVVCARVKTKE